MSDTHKTESLHDHIMRLPCTPPKDANVNQMLAYKSGHRDARHAAAELAAAYKADAQQAAPVAVPNESGLLPCPFCGGKAELHQRETESLWSHNQVTWSQVGCCECECVGADCCEDDDGSEAVAHWNTRAGAPSAPTPPAQQPVAVPDGWKAVPVDATGEMVEALKARIGVTSRGGILNAGHALSAAIAAAPTPPAQQSQLADTFMLVTPEQVDSHSTTAWECPPQSRVILVSSLERLHKKNAANLPTAPGDTAAPNLNAADMGARVGNTVHIIGPEQAEHGCSRCGATSAKACNENGCFALEGTAEQDAVTVPRELLGRITRNGGVYTLLAIDELRALLGGGA